MPPGGTSWSAKRHGGAFTWSGFTRTCSRLLWHPPYQTTRPLPKSHLRARTGPRTGAACGAGARLPPPRGEGGAGCAHDTIHQSTPCRAPSISPQAAPSASPQGRAPFCLPSQRLPTPAAPCAMLARARAWRGEAQPTTPAPAPLKLCSSLRRAPPLAAVSGARGRAEEVERAVRRARGPGRRWRGRRRGQRPEDDSPHSAAAEAPSAAARALNGELARAASVKDVLRLAGARWGELNEVNRVTALHRCAKLSRGAAKPPREQVRGSGSALEGARGEAFSIGGAMATHTTSCASNMCEGLPRKQPTLQKFRDSLQLTSTALSTALLPPPPFSHTYTSSNNTPIKNTERQTPPPPPPPLAISRCCWTPHSGSWWRRFATSWAR